MNLVFAGTPAFAVPSLEALLRAGHRVPAVYTQPDRPAGRGRKLAESAIKQCARAHDLPVHQPDTLRHAADELRALQPEAMIVIAYGVLLPPEILAIPKHGCLNVHASLLPRWRGAAPIARAIEAGDDTTGVTIMQMDAGLDTGPMLLARACAIAPEDTQQTLHDRLAQLGAETLIEALTKLERGELKPVTQDSTQATYAKKLRKDEAVLDWHQPALLLARKVRAFVPWPVVSTAWQGKSLRVWAASAQAPVPDGAPGQVLRADADGICVQTGDGVLYLTRLQAEGGKPLTAAEFLNGHRLAPGARLG
jgi:methionyl-tRNA formyltransferase